MTMFGNRSTKRMTLLEISPHESDRGELIGRNPRDLSPADFEAAGIELLPVMKAVRGRCLDCSGGSPAEVRKCVSTSCTLWALRLGVFPARLRAAANAHGEAATEEIEA